jgi:hypothetical protein
MGVYIVYSNIFDEDGGQLAKILMHVCATPIVAVKIIEIMKEQDKESAMIYEKYEEFGEKWMEENPKPDLWDEETYDAMFPKPEAKDAIKIWKDEKKAMKSRILKSHKEWTKTFIKAINGLLEQYGIDFEDLQSFPMFNDETVEYSVECEEIVFDVTPVDVEKIDEN